MSRNNAKSIEGILNSLSNIEEIILVMPINEENTLLYQDFKYLREKVITNIIKANKNKQELEYY